MDSLIVALGEYVGSRRHARDLISPGKVYTQPWWSYAAMSAAEENAQRISFVYGNVALSNPDITREMVEKAVDDA